MPAKLKPNPRSSKTEDEYDQRRHKTSYITTSKNQRMFVYAQDPLPVIFGREHVTFFVVNFLFIGCVMTAILTTSENRILCFIVGECFSYRRLLLMIALYAVGIYTFWCSLAPVYLVLWMLFTVFYTG